MLFSRISAISLVSVGILSGCATAAPENSRALLTHLSKPLMVDGQGRDWPVAPTYNLIGPNGVGGKLRVGYDAAHFYAFVEVKDDSPLKNSAGRLEEMLKGGDAVAFYFGNPADKDSYQRVLTAQVDGKSQVYLYRPQSKVKKPYTFVSPVGEAKFDYVAPFPAAVLNSGTSRNGYNLEISIPWKALGWDAPPAKFAFETQIIFSDPAGTTNAAMAWWSTRGGAGDTIEDLPSEARLYPESWGEAVLATVTDTGAPLILPATPKMAPGIPIRFDLPRDGRVSLVVTDASGWIVRELLLAEKMDKGTHTVEWDGRDRYDEPLPPGKYRWKALLFDGMGSKFYGSVGNSGRPPYRTPDGLGSIGGQHGVPTTVAADEGGIYMGGGAEEGQPAVRKIDAKTGAALWKRSVGGFGSALAIAAGENRACLIIIGGGRAERTVSLVRIDPQTGRDVGKDARITLPITQPEQGQIPARVGGMAIAGGNAFWSETLANRIGGANLETGALLPHLSVPAPQGLARFDAQNLLVCSSTQVLKLNLASGKTTPLLSGLIAPRAVARDDAGNLYVSDLGESQQIKKFSPDGKLLASWGAEGGKPATQPVYNPLALRNVTGLTLGPDGNLWSNEATHIPRRFVKMATDGRWLEDFYGPVAYNTFGPDLDDFSSVYYNTGGKSTAAHFVKARLNYEKYVADPNNPSAGWKIEAIYDLGVGADGKTPNELMVGVAATGYGHVFVFTGANGKKYLFRPSKQNRAAAPPGAGLWLWEKERWVPAAFLSSNAKSSGASWSDFNGDGLVQENERYATAPVQTYAWISRDLTLQGFDGTLTSPKVDARGVPDYRDGRFTPYLKQGEPNYQDGWTFVSPRVQDATYYVSNAGADRHLAFWDRASENRLIKVENGAVQWVIGQHEPKGGFAAFSTISGIAGIVDDIVIAHNVEPASYLAFTSDGFMLGNVLADEEGKHPPVGPSIVNIESFTGLFVKDPKSDKKLLFSVSSGDDRILEVTGPGQTTRLNGEFTLDTPRPRLVEGDNTTEIPYQNWIGNNPTSWKIDGAADEWAIEARGLPLYDGSTLIGDVRLRRDAGVLHVLADVLDTTPLETGEGIELNLAPENGEGTRIFLSADKDKKGVWKGGASLEKAGASVPATGAKVAVALRWRDLGYRLEAEIPLSLLAELTAPREQKVRRITKDARTGKMSAIENKTETLPDLRGPLRLQATVVRRDNGTSQRICWPTKSLEQSNTWGIASTP
jgi:hypothetical protein